MSEDMPPQLRDALARMSKRGKVVELTMASHGPIGADRDGRVARLAHIAHNVQPIRPKELCPTCKGRGERVLPNSSAGTECSDCEGTGAAPTAEEGETE